MDNSNVSKKKVDYKDNVNLIISAQNGDKRALNEVIENNLALVSAVSKRFMNRGYEFDDIFQIGCIGLVKAVKNFNISYNVKFSTYAVPMIIGEIKRFLRDDGMIKVSRNLKTIAKKIHFDRERLTKKLGREPTIEELSQYSKISSEDIVLALESSNNMEYLYDIIHQDDGSPIMLIDKLSQQVNEDTQIVDKIALKDVLEQLNSRARQVIMLRYFSDKTQIEVAKMIGISQVQVSRIEKKVLKIMKKKLQE